MKKTFFLSCAMAVLAAAPVLAQTTVRSTTTENADGSSSTTTKTVKKDGGGTATGAVGGAVAGALVAGPIGAVVGGVAGATIGHTVAPPSEVRTYVTTQDSPALAYNGTLEMNKRVDGEIAWRDVQGYPKYHWAHLNGERVVVDDNHNVVAIYTN
ncbi:MAG: hypothetical protein ACXU82_13430 [Caulobacteraceae bacterium]